MGVPGLWDLLRSAGEQRSLTHLAVVDGFQANTCGYRGFRVGIDASIWFFHAAYGKEGENPELRTLFFRCSRLLGMPFLPVFVFDGPKRPSVKRNKRVSGNAHWLTNGMKNIIEAFGFEWKTAPGEAEAELAFLNRAGFIDAVLSDDVDTFVFGGTTVVRNPSSTLSGNRAHPTKNSAGRDDGNHVVIYKSKDFVRPEIALTHGGLILIAILSGGDYHQAGLPRCGPNIAHGLAKCGFGDRLLEAARSMPRDKLEEYLVTWRQELCDELRTNSRGHIGRKNPVLAKSVTEDFPNVDVLLSYTNPITSESEGKSHKIKFVWDRSLDLGRIAHICELYFEWGVRSVIIKRFRTVIWPAAVLRLLREKVLIQDAQGGAKTIDNAVSSSDSSLSSSSQGPSSAQLVEDVNGNIIQKIHSTRMHASTDGLLEYRLEIDPHLIVSSAEAGIKDIRPPLISELTDSDDTDEGEETQTGTKAPPDPSGNFRVWIPACMVELAEPLLAEEFEASKRRKQEKKTKTAKTSKQTAKDVEVAPMTSKTSRTPKNPDVTASSGTEKSRGPHLKGFFSVSKATAQASAPKAKKVSAESSPSIAQSNTGSSILRTLEKSGTFEETKSSAPKQTLAAKPFPLDFDLDSEVLVKSPVLVVTRTVRPSPSIEEREVSLEKSPRKSFRQKPPHVPSTQTATSSQPLARTLSPSPTRSYSLPTKNDTSIINISSDEEDSPASGLKPSAAPLLIARARARPKSNTSRINSCDDIIDLT